MTKQAVVYARVSTEDQADHGFSLPSQLAACRRYAEAHRLEVAAQLQDDCSGAMPIGERPQGRQLGVMVARREVGAVVVHQVDRLSRDIVDLLATVRVWRQTGVEVHAGDVGRVDSELNIAFIIKGRQSSDERVKTRERTMRGKRAKARAGNVVGGREPYGYKHVRDESGRVTTFAIVKSEAEVVRMIYRLYLEGDGEGEPLSELAVARRLSELHIQTPGECRPGYKRTRAPGMWQAGKVLEELGHELYAGVWRYNVRIGNSYNKWPEDEQIKVSVPAIIDRATWEAVQKRKARNKRMARRNRKRDYLLSGLVKCACECAMCGNYVSDHRYYMCASRHNRRAGLEERTCRARSVRADAIEADVWDSFAVIFSDLARLEELLRQAQAEELAAMMPKRSELDIVEAMLAESVQQAADIASAVVRASGVVGRALERKAEAVNKRHEDLTKRRDELAVAVSAARITDAAISDTVKFAADVGFGLEGADYQTKRRILEMLDVTVTVDRGRFTVSSAIGEWGGEVRRLPGQRHNGRIVTDLCSPAEVLPGSRFLVNTPQRAA